MPNSDKFIADIIASLREITSRQALEVSAALEQSSHDSEYSSWRLGQSGPLNRTGMTKQQIARMEAEEQSIGGFLECFAGEFERLAEQLAEEEDLDGHSLPTPTVN